MAEEVLPPWNSKTYQFLKVEKAPNGVVLLYLNRPEKSNALNHAMFREISDVFQAMDAISEIKVVVLLGNGSNFCSGIDLSILNSSTNETRPTESSSMHAKYRLRSDIIVMQKSFSQIESCSKLVIAAVHGSCIGGGIDLITACDLRYCTTASQFSVKEIDFAIAADLGTLQRLPKLIGYGRCMELALTGRQLDGREAVSIGLVSAAYDSRDSLVSNVCKTATSLANKSPIAAAGTKAIMLHARDHSVEDSLNYTATWNAAMLSSDTEEAVSAHVQRRKPLFSNL